MEAALLVKSLFLAGCRKHHILLHDSAPSANLSRPVTAAPLSLEPSRGGLTPQPSTSSQFHNATVAALTGRQSILLATALVRIKASNGNQFVVRALLDTAADASLIAVGLAACND